MFYLIRSALIQSACLADCLVILVLSCQEAVRRQPRWPGHLREYSGVIIHGETCISLRLATDPAAVCVCVFVCVSEMASEGKGVGIHILCLSEGPWVWHALTERLCATPMCLILSKFVCILFLFL